MIGGLVVAAILLLKAKTDGYEPDRSGVTGGSAGLWSIGRALPGQEGGCLPGHRQIQYRRRANQRWEIAQRTAG